MSNGFDRRSFLTRSAITASGLVVGGAAVDVAGAGLAGAVQTNGAGRNGISSKKPKRGGHLIVGVTSEQQGFNPSTGRFDTSGFMYARAVFDPLLMITAKGAVAPYLAESVTPNSDYTKWTITLRPNVAFHDGTPCDGAALLQNVVAQVTSPLTGIALRPLIDSYAQSGPLSVTITMKNPWVTFPFTLAEQQISFVTAPSMLNAPNGGTDNPVGTGPFVFKEWIPNDHFTATANPTYWRPGLPYLGSVTFKPIPDEQARAQALQSGTIDMLHSVDPSAIKSFRGNRQWSYTNNVGTMVGSPALNMVMLNVAKAPFDDANARKVLAMGTSGAAYAKIIDQGVNTPSTGIYEKDSPYYTNVPYPKYDPAKAKKAAAAYKKQKGAALSFTLNVLATPQGIRQGEYYQQVMKNIGVAVTLKTMQQNVLINDALFGTYQATAWSQFGGMSPDLNYVWFSTETLNKTGISVNLARNDDPQIEQAFLTGMASTDRNTQVQAFAKVNQRLAVDLPYIWLDRTSWALVSKPNVQNWNNPKTPSGGAALGQEQGIWWLTQAWLS